MYSHQGSPYGGFGYSGSGHPPQQGGGQPPPHIQQPGVIPQRQQPFHYQPGTPMPQQPQFTQQPQQQPDDYPFIGDDVSPGMLPIEQSYIENILRLNRGRVGTFYMTYENNEKWNAKIFKGVIEAAGRDHIIISDPQTDKRYLLLMVTLDYVTFDDEIEYDYPFNEEAPGQQQLATYSPR